MHRWLLCRWDCALHLRVWAGKYIGNAGLASTEGSCKANSSSSETTFCYMVTVSCDIALLSESLCCLHVTSRTTAVEKGQGDEFICLCTYLRLPLQCIVWSCSRVSPHFTAM